MALLLSVDNLLGREGCESLGVPVYHAESAIDKALVIEVNEDFDNTLATSLVHCECCAIPVAAGTQTT